MHKEKSVVDRPEQTGEVVMEGVVAQILGVKLAAKKLCQNHMQARYRSILPEHCGRVKRFGLAVQVLRGKMKSQEGRERREGIEVQVSTGYWLPGWVLTLDKKFHDRQNM